jgi:hypothetical protein
MANLPGVETPGYFQASLRDARSIILLCVMRAVLRRKPRSELLLRPPIDPIIHRFVPELGILRLLHPVAFVREVKHL